MPLDGVRIAPGKPLLADQAREPVELEASPRVVLHVQPPLPAGQVFSVKLTGLAVSVGGAIQLHGTIILSPLSVSVKTRLAVFGQLEESVIFTSSLWPGATLPLAGLKSILGSPVADELPLSWTLMSVIEEMESAVALLVDADQFALLWLSGSLSRARLQFQTWPWVLVQSVFALILLFEPTRSFADLAQLHGTETILVAPSKLKEPVWQALFGIEMLICMGCPGDRVPVEGEKEARRKLLLALQAMVF